MSEWFQFYDSRGYLMPFGIVIELVGGPYDGKTIPCPMLPGDHIDMPDHAGGIRSWRYIDSGRETEEDGRAVYESACLKRSRFS